MTAAGASVAPPGELGQHGPVYLRIRSELELVFVGSPDWVCCFSCDLANFSAAAMGHPDKLWRYIYICIFLFFFKGRKKRRK